MDREKVVKGLEQFRNDLKPFCGNHSDWERFDAGLSLLKEQKIGHWIFLTDCSNSGVYYSEYSTKVFDSYPFKKKISYFCPHCGTRMEEEIERR